MTNLISDSALVGACNLHQSALSILFHIGAIRVGHNEIVAELTQELLLIPTRYRLPHGGAIMYSYYMTFYYMARFTLDHV